MKCIIHIDGGARGNPGPAAAGVTIINANTGEPVHEAGYYLGHMTNNAAEYNGLLSCLHAADQLKAEELTIYSDSQLMVRQINGEYKVKSADLKPLYTQAVKLLMHFSRWELIHVRREQNKRADELANLAMDAQTDVFFAGEGTVNPEQSHTTNHATGSLFEQTSPANPSNKSQSSEDNCFGAKITTNDCQNGCKKGREFIFGDKTPGGCCVHAAAAALSANPMKWDKDHTGEDMICNQCWQTIEVRRK